MADGSDAGRAGDGRRVPRRPVPLQPVAMDGFAQERLDPALITQVAHDTAAVVVRRGRASTDPQATERLVRLVDEIGLSTVADLWAQQPARSLPGALWRMYVLREWMRRDPDGAALDFRSGLPHAGVAEAVAGVASPPTPDEVRRVADEILRGVFTGDLDVALHRAAAFCRVVAAGRAGREWTVPGASSRASSLLDTAADLDASAVLWRDGDLT